MINYLGCSKSYVCRLYELKMLLIIFGYLLRITPYKRRQIEGCLARVPEGVYILHVKISI